MAKPITQEIVDKMNKWFENLMKEFEASDEYKEGDRAVYLTIESSPFKGSKWEIAPNNDTHYDIYELMPMLDRFEFEEEGGPAWYVSRA